MEGRSHSSSSSSGSSLGNSPELRPKCPKSPPPGALDLYGKRRQTLKVQVLEREIGLLQEELKLLEDLEPASGCCKELDTYMGAKTEPFIARNKETLQSHHAWKRIWYKFCCKRRWIRCIRGCSSHLEMPNCCTSCRSANFQQPGCRCLKKISCHNHCNCLGFSCLSFSCCCFKMSL